MAISIVTQPSLESWSSDLTDLSFSISGTRAAVVATLGGTTTLLSEVYYPVDGMIYIRDLSRLVEPYLETIRTAAVSFSISEQTYDSSTGITTVTDMTTLSFTVFLCKVGIPVLPSVFFAARFLTLLDGRKQTSVGCLELLPLYSAEGGEVVKVTAYYWQGNEMSIEHYTEASTTTAGYNSLDVSPSKYVAAGRDLVRYAVDCGGRRQVYDIDLTGQLGEPSLQFLNAFGMFETICCKGTLATAPEYNRSSAWMQGKLSNYDIQEDFSFQADTGLLPDSMLLWADDLMRSLLVYTVAGGSADRQIIITDSKSERDNADDTLVRYSFKYRYADRVQHIFNPSSLSDVGIFDDTFDNSFN